MDILLSILAFVCSIVGIAGCIVPVLPGVALSYVGLLCASFCSWSHVSVTSLLVWLGITIAVTLADFYLPAWMTRRFGGSRAGAVGATVGVVVGFFFSPVGILVGPFLGAVVGELLHNRTDAPKALLIGLGSFLSFIVGTGLKLVAAVGMFILLVADTYPALREWFVTTF